MIKNILILLIVMVGLSKGAIVHMNPYGETGLTSSLSTTNNFGSEYFQLLADPWNQGQGPEFQFTFANNDLIIGARYPGNENARVMAFYNGSIASIIPPYPTFNAYWPEHGHFWAPTGKAEYVGLFSNPSNTGRQDADSYHGWLKVSWNADTTVTVYDWAFQDTPNMPIEAGAIPEVETFPMVLLVGLLLLVHRRR